MSARDDYAEANNHTRGYSGRASRQTQDALDEIDRLRKNHVAVNEHLTYLDQQAADCTESAKQLEWPRDLSMDEAASVYTEVAGELRIAIGLAEA
jgi:hypothetical protein